MMKKIRILIVEDESLAAERLENLLTETGFHIEIAGKTASVKESVGWLSKNSADLIFLDIQLSDGLSFSIFERVSVNTPVIFTTAYDQYALKAFSLNSIAYLLKPIRKEELIQSLEKFRSMKPAFSIDFEMLLSDYLGEKPGLKKRFLIQIGDKLKKIEISEVAYFYASEKAIFMKTRNDYTYPLDYSLDQLEEMTDAERFFRINRKYLVCIDAISNMSAWSRSRIKLDLIPPPEPGEETVVSIDRTASFRKWLNS